MPVSILNSEISYKNFPSELYLAILFTMSHNSSSYDGKYRPLLLIYLSGTLYFLFFTKNIKESPSL